MATPAARIRRARLHAKLTQEELAVQVGVRRSAVSHWENESGNRPSAANVCEVATVTEVRLEWLATGRGPMKIDDSHQASAMVLSGFARDDHEARALLALRQIGNPRKREANVAMIEALAR